MRVTGQLRFLCVTTCGNILGPLIKSVLQAPQLSESNNSLWLSLYTLRNAFCHLLYCSLRLVELHERIDLLQRRLVYLGRLRRGKGENNQRKRALTQVYILCSRPLGERQVFIKGLYDFFLHLADCVRMHDPDWQRVHATALKGHIHVLQKQRKSVRHFTLCKNVQDLNFFSLL